MTAEPAATTTPEASAGFLNAIDTALQAEHWTRVVVRTPLFAAPVAAWTSGDHSTQLMITSAPDEPRMADFTGHPATIAWSLSITEPSELQILAAARAAAGVPCAASRLGAAQLDAVLRMVERLQRTGWSLHCGEAGAGVLFRLIRADGGLEVLRIGADADQPGGWLLEGHDLRADATDGTPTNVLAALAATLPEAFATGRRTPPPLAESQ